MVGFVASQASQEGPVVPFGVFVHWRVVRGREEILCYTESAGVLEEAESELGTHVGAYPDRGTIEENPVVDESFGYRPCRYGRQWDRAYSFEEPVSNDKKYLVSQRGSYNLS